MLANDLLARSLLGKGLKAPLEVDSSTQDFAGVEEEANTYQCILDLLQTRTGERVMNEDIGTIIPALVFEDSDTAIALLPAAAKEALEKYEPRIDRVQTSARALKDGNGAAVVYLDLRFRYKSTGRIDNKTIPYSINEGDL